MCLIIDKKQDYYRACKGFSINGVNYCRLLGTNGGIKNSTIVFVSDRVVDELRWRIANGRNPDKKFVTAKLEAYQALACSASNPVSMPKGIAVVNDCKTKFLDDVICLSNENDGEPIMEFVRNKEVKHDVVDGCGMMLPSLAERWSKELGLEYVMSGANTRAPFEKGMLFTFDFVDFANIVAGGNYIVKDAWGNDFDIREVEAIFTTSMMKLWDSYDSCEDYLRNFREKNYTFSITKVCDEELENEHCLNYQFIQPYYFSDEDIEELISPTINEFHEVIGCDWRKATLFLRGIGLNDKSIMRMSNDYMKAIMIEPKVMDDPYVRSHIYQTIRNRIDQAKVGVIKVHGNYSLISGDLYALCQSMYGMEITGLLKAGELYNKYWVDSGSDKVVCFRAPMTCANNIVSLHPSNTLAVRYWYKYMPVVTVLNGWDTTCDALNGCDMDGDLIFITDNNVMVNKHRSLPTLMCAQRKAEERISNENDFIKSNIESFGNDIGRTTNWITSMFEVQSRYDNDSEEYKVLDYRIQCGQQKQQDAIDKAKGIICKPMERSWHDFHAVNKIEDEEKRNLYRRIVADRKPYFMRYIYPALMRQYNRYMKNVNRNALREFDMTLDEMYGIPEDERTQRQNEFILYSEHRMPVGIGNCVMNKICRRFEEEFDGYIGRYSPTSDFDYTILKSDEKYTQYQHDAIKKLYDEYNKKLRSYKMFTTYERVDEFDMYAKYAEMNEEFRNECAKVCPNSKVLCNIVLDICYKRTATKRFAWAMCGDEIIENLLEKNNRLISYPFYDENGDFDYCGKKFSIRTISLEDTDENNS